MVNVDIPLDRIKKLKTFDDNHEKLIIEIVDEFLKEANITETKIKNIETKEEEEEEEINYSNECNDYGNCEPDVEFCQECKTKTPKLYSACQQESD